MKRGFPGTPVEEKTEADTELNETREMQKAADKAWSNSSANMMNEGEDENWRESSERYQIERRKKNSEEDDDY